MSLYTKSLNSQNRKRQIPAEFFITCHRLDVALSEYVLVVRVTEQRMDLFRKEQRSVKPQNPLIRDFKICFPYTYIKTMLISTSRFGTGQVKNSYKTPLGLHRIAAKIGDGYPPGIVFESRKPVGYTWTSHPRGAIVHRIMWLEGLEAGFNRGSDVDSFNRYIYIHGFSDETTLGKPGSRGCIHVSCDDIFPLFDILPVGTLVWITNESL